MEKGRRSAGESRRDIPAYGGVLESAPAEREYARLKYYYFSRKGLQKLALRLREAGESTMRLSYINGEMYTSERTREEETPVEEDAILVAREIDERKAEFQLKVEITARVIHLIDYNNLKTSL